MRAPPHLPFLDGPPDFTVGLRPIPPDRWLSPDWEADHLGEKRALIADEDSGVVQGLAGSEAAQAEAAALITKALHVAPVCTLADAALLVSDDLVVLTPSAQGFRAQALVLCAPTFFCAREALGRELHALHAPVPDRLGPGGDQGLGARIARVFAALRPELTLERFNWTVQAGAARFTPQAPPGDAGPPHLRVERQTIRRLPQSGGVLFTIRVSIDPLAAILEEPTTRAAFAAAWRGAPEHVRAYKRWERVAEAVEALITRR